MFLIFEHGVEMGGTLCHCTSQHANSPESENETRHKRHRKDHRDGYRKTGGHEELEDGELGEDWEID